MLQYVEKILEHGDRQRDLLLLKKTDWFKLLQLPDMSWLSLLTASVCTVVVVWIIIRFVTRVNEDVDPAEADREMLQALNDLRREGDLTEDEFRSIKGQITGRLATSWSGSGKSDGSAKTADRGLSGLRRVLDSRGPQENESLAPEFVRKPSESEQSETFASPTTVPEAAEEPSNLAKRPMASKSEDGEGNRDSDFKKTDNEDRTHET